MTSATPVTSVTHLPSTPLLAADDQDCRDSDSIQFAEPSGDLLGDVQRADAFTRIREAGLHPVTAFMVPLGYWVFLMTATHWPSLSMNELHSSDYADKFYHFFGYMGLATLTLFAIRMSEKHIGLRTRTVRLAIRGFVFFPLLLAAAIADELTQPLVDRNCSVYDMLFDFIGIAIPMGVSCAGLCFMALFERRHGEP